MKLINKNQFGNIISTSDAQNQVQKQVQENSERSKNGGLTDSEVKARKLAAATAIAGQGLVFTPAAPLGYAMQVPDALYNVHDAVAGYDSAVHLAPDVASATGKGINAVTKIIPGKVDDIAGYTLQALGTADNVDQALGYDHVCQITPWIKDKYQKSKNRLISKKKNK